MNKPVYLDLSILDISKIVMYESWHDYKSKRSLPMKKTKNRKVIGLMKDELGQKIMKNFAELKPIKYNCLKDDGWSDKKANVTKNSK